MLTIQLNIYPAARGFTAIGSGGDDFVQSMVVAVESVIQHPIPQVSLTYCCNFITNTRVNIFSSSTIVAMMLII